MLNVYMTGLIYFNGCEEANKRVYAPNGTANAPPLYASLWIAAVDVTGDSWAEKTPHDRGAVIAFLIPSPATLTFPASGGASCTGLETGLSKVKKQQGSSQVDLQVSPTPDTIAEIPIDGGAITPRFYKGIRLVQWEIASASDVQITATLGSGGTRTVTVKKDAEVVFANIPTGSVPGGYVHLFDKLTVQPGLLIADPPAGSVSPIPGNNALLEHVRFGVLGNTPGCCRGIHHHH